MISDTWWGSYSDIWNQGIRVIINSPGHGQIQAQAWGWQHEIALASNPEYVGQREINVGHKLQYYSSLHNKCADNSI